MDSQIDRQKLFENLNQYFSLDELQDLCFTLGIDWEYLAGETKSRKARELISYLERRYQLGELLAQVRQMRPFVQWGSVPADNHMPDGYDGSADLGRASDAQPDTQSDAHRAATELGASQAAPARAPDAGISQQASDNAIQIGAVNGGSVIIYRSTQTTPESLRADPARSRRLKPVVDVLANKFTREGFFVLCFNIGINYDRLAPGGLESQAIQLVTVLDNANQLQVLIDAINVERPGSLVKGS